MAIKSASLAFSPATRERLRALVEPLKPIPFTSARTHWPMKKEIDAALKEMWEAHQKTMLLIVDSLQPCRGSTEKMKGYHSSGGCSTLTTKTQTMKGGSRRLSRRKSVVAKTAAPMTKLDSGGKGAGGIEYKAEMVFDLRRDRQSGGVDPRSRSKTARANSG